MKNLSSCHILLFSIIFAIAKRETPFMEKIIDENKQETKLVLEEKKENQPLLLVGHSYGGPISARLAMDFPDLVDAMILLAPAVSPEDERVFWVSYPADFFLIKWILPKSIRVSNDEKLAHAEELRKMLDLWENIAIPTTIIQGDKDWIVPPANADFAEKMIAKEYLNLIRIDSASHFVPWTQFDLVKKMILEQLEDLQQDSKKQ